MSGCVGTSRVIDETLAVVAVAGVVALAIFCPESGSYHFGDSGNHFDSCWNSGR